MTQVSVVLIDNHPFYREGMKRILEVDLSFNVVSDGDEQLSVVDAIKSYSPTLLLIDVNVMRQKEISIKEDVLSYSPETKVVVIGFEDEGDYVTEALRKGAHGFLLKNMDVDDFTQAIQSVLDGMYRVDQSISHYVVEDYVTIAEEKSGDTAEDREAGFKRPLHLYTKRECEVLQLLADGMSNRSIAEELNISEKTVKNHVSSLFKKMNVNDRTQAVVTAIRNDWVEI